MLPWPCDNGSVFLFQLSFYSESLTHFQWENVIIDFGRFWKIFLEKCLIDELWSYSDMTRKKKKKQVIIIIASYNLAPWLGKGRGKNGYKRKISKKTSWSITTPCDCDVAPILERTANGAVKIVRSHTPSALRTRFNPRNACMSHVGEQMRAVCALANICRLWCKKRH